MNFLHKHKWVKMFSSRWGTVDKCLNCPEYQTTLFDYSRNEYCSVPGNFLSASMRHNQAIYILCGNLTEFQNAQRILRLSSLDFSFNQIQRLMDLDKLRGLRNPVIYLYGTWYENDLCQDPEFTRIMNGWL